METLAHFQSEWNVSFSLSRTDSVCISVCLLVACEHFCMTKEMQSLAQTITICLVCAIYMKYIFIHDIPPHGEASFSPSLPLMCLHLVSALAQDELCSESLSNKHTVTYVPLFSFRMSCVIFHRLYFIHIVLFCSMEGEGKDNKQQQKTKQRGSASFAPLRECKRERNVSLAPIL